MENNLINCRQPAPFRDLPVKQSKAAPTKGNPSKPSRGGTSTSLVKDGSTKQTAPTKRNPSKSSRGGTSTSLVRDGSSISIIHVNSLYLNVNNGTIVCFFWHGVVVRNCVTTKIVVCSYYGMVFSQHVLIALCFSFTVNIAAISFTPAGTSANTTSGKGLANRRSTTPKPQGQLRLRRVTFICTLLAHYQ